MAWVWWLLAPVCSTAIGALVLSWRGWTEWRSSTLRPGNAIAEHHAILEALTSQHGDAVVPVNLILIPAPAEQSELAGS
ncbi:hypothetical protein ACSMXN_10150 [Jatrophihabitans sp. DSM 45814]